jgi:metallo-beta-lactamase family protein
MIELESLGAAQTVTGSKHLVRTSRANILLDCGLFQGRRAEAWRRNHELPIDGIRLDAVVLSHAHIDHSGALPLLYQKGYRGPVYATPATRDLCAPMLLDNAHIQESDALHIQRLIDSGTKNLEPVQPLYTTKDAVGVLGQMVSLPYHRPSTIAPGVSVHFFDAGHVLGSAIVVLDIEDEGRQARVAFTGDLGRPHMPIVRDPETPDGVNYLLMESTYGDRLHQPIDKMTDSLAEVISRTYVRGGKVLIPSFALERAQEIVYALKQLQKQGRLPPIPVYVDSPLTVRLTEVFKLHPECYDEETLKLLRSADNPFDFEGLKYISSAADSMAIDAASGPAVIISSSGMLEGGRVLHHLKSIIGHEKHTVLIVGYQAENTLGRQLVEKRKQVRIFGTLHNRAADVVVLNGFSAHADQAGLLQFAKEVATRGHLRRIFLIHGEGTAQKTLAQQLMTRGICSDVAIPAMGESLRLE